MFSLSRFLGRLDSDANAHGFNCAFLGLDKVNPYPPNTIDHKQFEWGWKEGEDVVQEYIQTPIYNPSKDYGDYHV